MVIIGFLFSIYTLNVFASTALDGALVEKQDVESEILKVKEYRDRDESAFTTYQEELNIAEKRYSELISLKKNQKSIIESTLKEVETMYEKLPVTKKLLSKKSGFYKCVRDSLRGVEKSNIEACRITYPGKFSPEEEDIINRWDKNTSSSPKDIDRQLSEQKIKIDNVKSRIQSRKNNLDYYNKRKKLLTAQLSEVVQKIEEENFVRSNSSFFVCDSNMKTINLEEKTPFEGATFKGPFYNVPRDHQDGIGSCYANAAKNLLVGLSHGENIPSFLDLALLSKSTDQDILKDGLDGGQTCETLKKVQEHGYCAQKYSSLENGNDNSHSLNILGHSGGIYEMSRIIDLIKKFFSGSQSNISIRDVVSKVNTDSSLTCEIPEAQRPVSLPDIEKLVNHLSKNGSQFNNRSQPKSVRELIQNLIAPECLDPNKRTKLSFNFTCQEDQVYKIKASGKPIEEQMAMMRRRVVSGLLEGFPSGNTFWDSTAFHINTIVGVRFNKDTRTCEYNIRESQNGKSEWKSEKKIFENIKSLVEVRKK